MGSTCQVRVQVVFIPSRRLVIASQDIGCKRMHYNVMCNERGGYIEEAPVRYTIDQ